MRKINQTVSVSPVSADLDTTGQGATPISVAKRVRTPAKPKAIVPAAPVSAKPAKPVKPVSAKTVKQPSAPKLVAAKPVSTADAEAAAEQAKRAEATIALRKAVARRYEGASKAFHTSRATSPGDILSVIASPKHRIATGTPPTVRDASLAHVLSDIPSGTNVLSILELGADLGVISRLASIGCFTVKNNQAILVSRAAIKAVTKQCRPTTEQLADRAA